MKNNGILSFGISALATASVFTASSLVATPPLVTAVASAQTHDAMPGKYYIEPASDAQQYLPMLNSYVSVAKLRHVYHTATGTQKFENYPGTQEQRTAHEESERACYLAKARVTLAILQVEGDAEARSLDISKVGIELETTRKAIPLLKKVKDKYWSLSFRSPNNEPNQSKYDNTHRIANDGLYRLEEIVSAGKIDENERNAFSIADWGVEERFVTPLLEQHHLDSDEKGLKTYKANLASSEKAKMAEEAESSGAENQERLLKKNGGSSIPAPKPYNKVPPAEEAQISWSPTTWPTWLKVIVSLGSVGLLAGLLHALLPFLPR